MSRALDKETLTSLKTDDPTLVYIDIARVLTTLPNNGLLDIELLGESHTLQPGVNFLQDGNALAIPKLRLVQAFFGARQIIQKHLSGSSKLPSDETLKATAVVLLMDPEHLTAANIRKRAVQSSLTCGTSAESILRREKQFVDSLLTARLHRHTKSPVLWSHRSWLMRTYRGSGLQVNIQEDLVNVIMVAAERHPTNYYAWTHARTLIEVPFKGQPVFVGVVDAVKLWCFRHHSDISGWMFLSYILLHIYNDNEGAGRCSSVTTDTLDIVDSFRWMNESVWVFLRTMVAREFISNEIFEHFETTNRNLFSAAGKDSRARRTLDEAQQWVCQNRQKPSGAG